MFHVWKHSNSLICLLYLDNLCLHQSLVPGKILISAQCKCRTHIPLASFKGCLGNKKICNSLHALASLYLFLYSVLVPLVPHGKHWMGRNLCPHTKSKHNIQAEHLTCEKGWIEQTFWSCSFSRHENQGDLGTEILQAYYGCSSGHLLWVPVVNE